MKSFTVVFVVFCLAHFNDVHAKVKVLQKSLVEHERRLVFTHVSYVDARLAYALCDKNPPADEVNCTVIREKQPYGDDVYSCNVTIKRKNGDAKYEPDIRLFQFGDRYVTLNSWDGGSSEELRFTTVNLDSCKYTEAKFNASIGDHYWGMKYVAHNDSFDVFHPDSEKCGENRCRVTINAEGKIISQGQSSIGRYVALYIAKKTIIALDESSAVGYMGGYFYLKYERELQIMAYTLVKPDGNETTLARHSTGEIIFIAESTKNGLIGVCYQTDTEYNCSQYDYDGKLKLNKTIARDDKDKMELNDIHNSANGGLYVLSRVLCGSSGCHTTARYVIERIDASGSKSQPLTFQVSSDYLNLQYFHASLFFENESKEICVSLVIFNSRQSRSASEGIGRLYSTANCFTDADFSQ